jgi:hypothetical protein
MKALLLHHPYTYPRFEQDFVASIAALPEFDVAPADLDPLDAGVLASGSGAIELSRYDAVVVFVAFKRLRAASTLAWDGFAGLRVLMDHDIIQNYSDIFDPTLKGAWPPVFRRHRFDLIVTSGRAVQSRLESDGIAAEWVAKAFEPTRFSDADAPREGVVTYGSAYLCRQLAERAITDAELPLTRLPMTAHLQLNAHLNRFLGCMAISSDIDVPLAERESLQHAVARDVAIKPGLEPMAKFFEAAGAGCCPIVDAMDDLQALGFRDNQNALTFASHAELVDKLKAGLAAPEKMRAIGAAASKLAHAEHTWAHRAHALRGALRRRL